MVTPLHHGEQPMRVGLTIGREQPPYKKHEKQSQQQPVNIEERWEAEPVENPFLKTKVNVSFQVNSGYSSEEFVSSRPKEIIIK